MIERWFVRQVEATDAAGRRDERSTRDLRAAMGRFDFCQDWSLCELHPPKFALPK